MNSTLGDEIASPKDVPDELILHPRAYSCLMGLLDRGANDGFVPILKTDDRHSIGVLQGHGLTERAGFKPGPYGTLGRIRIARNLDHVVCGNEPTPRVRRAKPGAPVPSTMIQIPRAAIPLPREAVVRFIAQTDSTSQREFERRKQLGLSGSEVAKELEGKRGDAVIVAMKEIMARTAMTFEQYLIVTLGFPREMVEILGIPEVGADTPEPWRGQR